MPWTHKDFAEMHFLYGFYDGDAQGAAGAFRNKYEFKKKYGINASNQDSGDDNSEDPVFPTSIDILRIHELYQKGQLPDENTVTGGRKEGERIRFSHSDIMEPKITTKYTKDRLKLSKELLKKCEDEKFVDCVLWTGVAIISSNHFCGNNYERHYETDNDDGNEFEAAVWVGLLDSEIIGPYELPLDITVTDENYAKFLQEDLPGLLEAVPSHIKEKMWIHVEDAKYVGESVKKFLNDNYEGRWIGPDGPIHWPPMAAHLNPVKFVWGFVLVEVYENKCDSKEEILERVDVACAKFEENVTREQEDHPGRIGLIKENFLKRCNACVKEKGGDFTYTVDLL